MNERQELTERINALVETATRLENLPADLFSRREGWEPLAKALREALEGLPKDHAARSLPGVLRCVMPDEEYWYVQAVAGGVSREAEVLIGEKGAP
jgi:hypothetical protein